MRVVLDSVRSALNVGAILRTADCAGVEGVDLCGPTPCPPNPKIEKTALGAKVPWEHHPRALDVIRGRSAEGWKIVAIETIDGAPSLFEADLSEPCLVVLGHEVLGVDPEILDHADEIVQIPTEGSKRSLNVATAFGVVAYEFYRRRQVRNMEMS